MGWVVPVVMVGMFAGSTFVLGKHILCSWLGAEGAGGSFVMFLLLFLFYQVLEAPYEGIYWYNGATHYVLMQSVWFFTLAAISAALWTPKKSREVLLCVIAALLAVIVGGGNLVTGLQAYNSKEICHLGAHIHVQRSVTIRDDRELPIGV